MLFFSISIVVLLILAVYFSLSFLTKEAFTERENEKDLKQERPKQERPKPKKKRKKIVFLFSGNARTSPFTVDPQKRSREILDSYNRYVFTDEFKEKYDYEVYITSDNIDLKDTVQYFSQNHIKNIHLLDSDYYLTTNSETNPEIKNIEYYLNKYNDKDWTYYDKYDGSIHQHYKILDSYNLAKKNGSLQDADYIVRIRMDVKFHKNIEDVLEKFEENPDLEVVLSWDYFAIGKPEIMECYCTGLENNYGNYKYEVPVPEKLPIMEEYFVNDKKRWTYAAERQLFEMLYDYCHQKNLDINKTIMKDKICSIER